MATMETLFGKPQNGDDAKRRYLAQFEHPGCGGAPVAYINGAQLGCTGCSMTWPAAGKLGDAVATQFHSIVLVEKF